VINANEGTRKAPWIVGLMLGLFCMWLVFTSTRAGGRVEGNIRDSLPGWILVCNFFLAPCFMVSASGPLRIPVSVRLVAGALMFGSMIIVEIAFNRFRVASSVVVLVLVAEVYWVIPKWNASHKSVPD
jgi:hypothetical protein